MRFLQFIIWPMITVMLYNKILSSKRKAPSQQTTKLFQNFRERNSCSKDPESVWSRSLPETSQLFETHKKSCCIWLSWLAIVTPVSTRAVQHSASQLTAPLQGVLLENKMNYGPQEDQEAQDGSRHGDTLHAPKRIETLESYDQLKQIVRWNCLIKFKAILYIYISSGWGWSKNSISNKIKSQKIRDGSLSLCSTSDAVLGAQYQRAPNCL